MYLNIFTLSWRINNGWLIETIVVFESLGEVKKIKEILRLIETIVVFEFIYLLIIMSWFMINRNNSCIWMINRSSKDEWIYRLIETIVVFEFLIPLI